MVGKIIKWQNKWGQYLIKPITLDQVYVEAHFATRPYNSKVWKYHGIGAFWWEEMKSIKVVDNPPKSLKVFP